MIACGRYIRWVEDHDDCTIKSYGYEGQETALMIREDKEKKSEKFVRYPGLDHLCIRVGSKEKVAAVYRIVKSLNYFVTLDPKDYPEYCDPYNAFYFRDPDGIPLEVAHY